MTEYEIETILHNAAQECGINSHIIKANRAADLYTLAEKGIRKFGYKTNTQHINSFLYLDSVDACFYIADCHAHCNIAAHWTYPYCENDLEKIGDAAKIIDNMLSIMNRMIGERG